MRSLLLFTIVLLLACNSGSTDHKSIKNQPKNSKKYTSSQEIELKTQLIEDVSVGNVLSSKKVLSTNNSLIDLSKTYEGKALVIDFWAMWCAPCLKLVPKFKELESKYENEKIEFLTISIDEDFQEWKTYIHDNEWQTNNYWLGRKEFEPLFGFMYSVADMGDNKKKILTSLPRYVVISSSGTILSKKFAKPNDPDFAKKLFELIQM